MEPLQTPKRLFAYSLIAIILSTAITSGIVYTVENNLNKRTQNDLQAQIANLKSALAIPPTPPASTSSTLNILDVTQLKVGDQVGTLTIASVTPTPGESTPISNTDYDIAFSGSVSCQTTLLVGDTDGTPGYSLDPSGALPCQQLPVINGLQAFGQAGQSRVSPDSAFSMDTVFGKYTTAYASGSKLTATYTFDNIEYIYRPATGTNGYLNVNLKIAAAKNPLIAK